MKLKLAPSLVESGDCIVCRTTWFWAVGCRKAWAIGAFMGTVGEGMFETNEATVADVVRTYYRLEIHKFRPQMYVVVTGSVAAPSPYRPLETLCYIL